MRKPILRAAVIAVALLTSTGVIAQAAQFTTDPNAGTDVAVRDDIQPLAPLTITQSTDPDTLEDNTSVACQDVGGTTENSWLRLFDLDDDHGWVDTFRVASIEWGIQRVIGSLDLTVNVYCLDETLPFLYEFMVLKDAVVVPLADEVLTFHSTQIGGSCDSLTEDMAIDLHAEDCNIVGCTSCFIGTNALGQTAPTYIASASCGFPDPTDLTGQGYPNSHLVMKVNGVDDLPDDDGGSDDGGDVPATTSVGAVLLLLILLGSGAYFLRRRASL